MGLIVIACYRPKPGREDALVALVREHVPNLRAWGLATNRAPVLMRAGDGTIVEVFEWASKKAIDDAHGHPRVAELWRRLEAVSEYTTVGHLPEAHELFATFAPVA